MDSMRPGVVRGLARLLIVAGLCLLDPSLARSQEAPAPSRAALAVPLPQALPTPPVSVRRYAPLEGPPSLKVPPVQAPAVSARAVEAAIEDPVTPSDVAPQSCAMGCERAASDSLGTCNGMHQVAGSLDEAKGLRADARAPAAGCRARNVAQYRQCMTSCGTELPPRRPVDPRRLPPALQRELVQP